MISKKYTEITRFRCYKVLEKDLKIEVYFADAYSSW